MPRNNYSNITWKKLGAEWEYTVRKLREKHNITVTTRCNVGLCGFLDTNKNKCEILRLKPSRETCERCKFFKTAEEVEIIFEKGEFK